MVEEVGDQQQGIRCSERRIVRGGHRCELEHGVDREQLDAGALVELARRHACEDVRHRRRAPRVAVVDGVLDEAARRIEQAEVDRPRVDGDRVDRGVASSRPQAVERVPPKTVQVPAKRPRRLHRLVREPVRLGNGEPLAVEAPDRDAAALRAEVDRGHDGH